MLHVLSPALEIPGNVPGDKEDPEKVIPHIPVSHGTDHEGPEKAHDGKLSPDLATDLFVPDEGIFPQEHAGEKEGSEKEARIELDEGYPTPEPTRRVNFNKGPQFLITLGGQMHVVSLVRDPVEREAHEAQGAGYDSVNVIQEPVFPQQTVGSLVKTDQRTMHEVAGEDHHRNAQPEGTLVNGKSDSDLGKNQRYGDQRKSSLRDPMLVDCPILLSHAP
jgi:hypothetical protein